MFRRQPFIDGFDRVISHVLSVAENITSSRPLFFPGLNNKQQCVGVVFLDDMRPHLFDTSLYDLVTMGSVMRTLPAINMNEQINSALNKFETSKAWSLPVVEGDKFLGMLSKSTLFDHYRRELQIQEI